MLDEEMQERVNLVKASVVITDVDSSLRTGTNNCLVCGGRSKAYVAANQYYKCYSSKCGFHGDVIALHRAIHGTSFMETLTALEQIAGIVHDKEQRSRRASLLNQVIETYASILWIRSGKPALDYLRGRGFDDIALHMHQVGYAPTDGTLRRYGFSAADLSSLGLYDGHNEYFSNRIVFPIRDTGGNPVHLIGRWLGSVPTDEHGNDKWPRYKDSKGNPSSKNYLAFEHLMGGLPGSLTLTEGYPDALMLNQMGVPSVGLLGLEGLVRHAHKLARFKELTVLADNDRFPEDHPNFPGQYKTWSRLLPQLADLQVVLPATTIYWMPVPEGHGKDVNDWVRGTGIQSSELKAHIVEARSELISSLVGLWERDYDKHVYLLRAIASTGRGAGLLEAAIKRTGMSPVEYALSVMGS